MKRKIKLGVGTGFAIVMLLGMITGALAQQFPLTERTLIQCTTNQTLSVENVEQRCINNICRNFTVSKEVFCEFGCSNETIQPQCNPSPFDTTIYYSIPLFAGFFGVLIWVGRRLT